MKYIIFLILLSFSLISCREEKKVFEPKPTYEGKVYMKPDSTIADIIWFGVFKKDTTYFYGVEYKDSLGIQRKIIYDKDIFGKTGF